MLDGGFLNSTTAVAVPRTSRPRLPTVTAFIEEAKGSGLIRRALDAMGLKTSQVAPVGMKALRRGSMCEILLAAAAVSFLNFGIHAGDDRR